MKNYKLTEVTQYRVIYFSGLNDSEYSSKWFDELVMASEWLDAHKSPCFHSYNILEAKRNLYL